MDIAAHDGNDGLLLAHSEQTALSFPKKQSHFHSLVTGGFIWFSFLSRNTDTGHPQVS